MDRVLFLVRGIPGSGKSTFAPFLTSKHIEADMYFTNNGEYNFDPSKLSHAHKWCQDTCEDMMKWAEPKIVVSNTFSIEWEMNIYYELADKYGYKVFSVIVENRHGNQSIHEVPDQTIENMKNRFEVKI
jgi:predicted kinase